MKKYLIVIKRTETGYSAYSPDLPGCVATAATRRGVERTMEKAIAFHLEGMCEDGEPIPRPHSYSAWCEVPARRESRPAAARWGQRRQEG